MRTCATTGEGGLTSYIYGEQPETGLICVFLPESAHGRVYWASLCGRYLVERWGRWIQVYESATCLYCAKAPWPSRRRTT